MDPQLTPAHLQLIMMSREYVVSRAIHVVAHLGIADYMSDQPLPVQQLAELTATIPELLDRLLSFLSAYGLFIKSGSAYALTPLSLPLRQDHPNSVKDILGMFNEPWWQAFAHLETTLKTGRCAFKEQHGLSFFDFMETHPAKKAEYEQGMKRLALYDDSMIAHAFDFSQFNHIVEIGFGRKGLTEAINKKYPSIQLGSFPLDPHLSTDFFMNLPQADAYLFKAVLHDFNNLELKKILQQSRKMMRPQSSLIIIEQVIPDNEQPHTNKTMDIIMMVLVGGRQHTLANWIRIVEEESFKLKTIQPLPGIFSLMEFTHE